MSQTIEETLKERGARYNKNGTYRDHGTLTQHMKEICRSHPGWWTLDAGHKEAVDMILHKVARVINGDPYYYDNWRDIAGYAKLAEDIKRLNSLGDPMPVNDNQPSKEPEHTGSKDDRSTQPSSCIDVSAVR